MTTALVIKRGSPIARRPLTPEEATNFTTRIAEWNAEAPERATDINRDVAGTLIATHIGPPYEQLNAIARTLFLALEAQKKIITELQKVIPALPSYLDLINTIDADAQADIAAVLTGWEYVTDVRKAENEKAGTVDPPLWPSPPVGPVTPKRPGGA